MRGVYGLSAALAAANVAAKPVKRDVKLPDIQLPECESGKLYSDYDDIGKLWGSAGIENYVDEFIKMNGDHSNWVQNLYMKLFEDEDHTKMSCITTGSACQSEKKCKDFNEIGKGGLYYLFVSLMNFHSFMGELRDRFWDASTETGWKVDGWVDDIDIEGSSGASLNLFSILSAALTMASGASVVNAPFSGALAATAGLSSALSLKESSDTPLGDQAVAKMNDMLADATKGGYESIDSIVAAVYGKQGHSQDDIPESMSKGKTDNRAVSIFGYGAWLVDHPNFDMTEHFEQMKKMMEQALVWHTVRLFKGTYVIIRDDMEEGDCTGTNNAWDKEKSRCLDFMAWNQKATGTFGGANDVMDMWENHGMDQFYTLRNAVECWEDNDGNLGEPAPFTDVWKYSTPPPCFFSQTVMKGSWSKEERGILRMDGDFPGQDGKDGKVWPDDKCPVKSLFSSEVKGCPW